MNCQYCGSVMQDTGRMIMWRPGRVDAVKVGVLECPQCYNTVMLHLPKRLVFLQVRIAGQLQQSQQALEVA